MWWTAVHPLLSDRINGDIKYSPTVTDKFEQMFNKSADSVCHEAEWSGNFLLETFVVKCLYQMHHRMHVLVLRDIFYCLQSERIQRFVFQQILNENEFHLFSCMFIHAIGRHVLIQTIHISPNIFDFHVIFHQELAHALVPNEQLVMFD